MSNQYRPIVLVLRSQHGCAATVRFWRQHGVVAQGMVVSTTTLQPVTIPTHVKGILVTSFRALLSIPSTETPLYCVGAATAARAQRMGFNVAKVGQGNAVDLATALVAENKQGPLLHTAGDQADPAAWQPLQQNGVQVLMQTAYTTHYVTQLSRAVTSLLKHNVLQWVVGYSAAGVATFVQCAQKAGVDINNLSLLALSEQVAAAGNDFKQIVVAPNPTQQELWHTWQTKIQKNLAA